MNLDAWFKDEEQDDDYYRIIPKQKRYLFYSHGKVTLEKFCGLWGDFLLKKVEDDKNKKINKIVFENSRELLVSIFEKEF
jgi:hypothetical protein